jgi:hypothetical protein
MIANPARRERNELRHNYASMMRVGASTDVVRARAAIARDLPLAGRSSNLLIRSLEPKG